MKSDDLIELLKNHTVYIQTHNFPDPDAIASAFGLQKFLKYYGIESTLCYYGKIDKLSTKRMLTTFGIQIYSKDELQNMKDEDYIVNVDSQKHNANVMDFVGEEVACIDHHPTFVEADYQYKDIRIVGACATLIAEYASLHCPISIILGSPPISPRSRSLKRYLPQASVRITESFGVCLTNSV